MQYEHDGYLIGYDPSTGEVACADVCEHGQNLGWACPGCAKDLGRKVGTAAAGPAADTKYRAVCDHCGGRVWLLSAQVPEHIRIAIDAEEKARREAARERRWNS